MISTTRSNVSKMIYRQSCYKAKETSKATTRIYHVSVTASGISIPLPIITFSQNQQRQRCYTTNTPHNRLETRCMQQESRFIIQHTSRSKTGVVGLISSSSSSSSASSSAPLSSTVRPVQGSRRFYSTSTINLQEYPPHTLFPMPALSPTMETGSIASWNIQVGDSFAAGDSLCTIETDKASVDFEAQDDGILAKILVQPGQDVPIGTPICIVTDDANDVPAFQDYVVAADSTPAVSTPPSTTTAATTVPTPTVTTSTSVPTPSSSPSSSILFPSARHLAESKGKDATGLVGSGKGGRVTKADVQIALETNILPNLPLQKKSTTITTAMSTAETSTPSSTAPVSTPVAMTKSPVTDLPIPEVTGQTKFDDVPNNKMRKIIASRLTASKREVPHCYVSMEIALDDIMKLRKNLQKNHEIKISVNDFIIRACALSLRDVPDVNHMYDTKQNTITYNSNIDISVAVATPTGLITPIVFNTDQLGLYEITNTVKDLASRARDGLLQPKEYQGGTFSISNLGMFGIDEFSAVINPPQAAILAVGGGTPTFVPASSSPIDGNIKNPETEPAVMIQNIMTARLSADRRVVDEATASLFLQVLRHYMQTPELLVL